MPWIEITPPFVAILVVLYWPAAYMLAFAICKAGLRAQGVDYYERDVLGEYVLAAAVASIVMLLLMLGMSAVPSPKYLKGAILACLASSAPMWGHAVFVLRMLREDRPIPTLGALGAACALPLVMTGFFGALVLQELVDPTPSVPPILPLLF